MMDNDPMEFNRSIAPYAGHVTPDQYAQLILTFNIDGTLYRGRYDGVKYIVEGYNGPVDGTKIVNVQWKSIEAPASGPLTGGPIAAVRQLNAKVESVLSEMRQSVNNQDVKGPSAESVEGLMKHGDVIHKEATERLKQIESEKEKLPKTKG